MEKINSGRWSGVTNPKAKLTNEQTAEVVYKYFDLNMGLSKIARIYNVTPQCIFHITKKEKIKREEVTQ
jgi:predicted DNA-binding protein YlxM (UPF0122 family)